MFIIGISNHSGCTTLSFQCASCRFASLLGMRHAGWGHEGAGHSGHSGGGSQRHLGSGGRGGHENSSAACGSDVVQGGSERRDFHIFSLILGKKHAKTG